MLPNLPAPSECNTFATADEAIPICPPIPCSAVAASYGTLAPCSGNGDLLNHFGGDSRDWRPGAPARPELRSAVWSGLGSGQSWTNRRPCRHRHVLRQQRFSQPAAGSRKPAWRMAQFNAQANDPCASHGEVIFPGNIAQSAAGLCGQPHRKRGDRKSRILQTAFQAANAAADFQLAESQLSGTVAKQPAGPAGAQLPDSALGCR